MGHADHVAGSKAARHTLPWFAALLSLFITGLGHVYAGRARRGLGFFVLGAATASAGLVIASRGGSVFLYELAFIASVGLTVYAAIDAWRLARRRDVPPTARFDQWYAYALFVVVWSFVISAPSQRWLKANVVEAVRTPSESMAPTLQVGDYFFAAPKHGAVRRGEIVVYHWSGNLLVKRVVAIAGDTIEMRDGELFISNAPSNEPYRVAEKEDVRTDDFNWQRALVLGGRDTMAYRPTLMTWGPLLVPSGKVFILGDNRGNSLDSRYVGFIDVDSIVKSPTFVYLSWDPDAHSIRWNRIGQRLEFDQ